ncbi:MAG: hypothetical protein JXA67_06905 [Micromonosporaceae bacterium]|nr:hypothetical protein [Micromonosporaceae bacterium]
MRTQLLERRPQGSVRPTAAGWTVLVVVIWTIALTALTIRGVQDGPATAPEQISIGPALADADAVLTDLITAIDPTRTVVRIGEFRQIEDECQVTAARSGTRHERIVNAYAAPGGEANLLASLAASMPERYEIHLRTQSGGVLFTAIDSDFITVRGTVSGSGEIRVSIDTGCRPGQVPQRGQDGLDQAPQEARDAAAGAIAALGLTPTSWEAVTVECTDERRMWMVTASATGSVLDLGRAINAPPGSTAVLDQPTIVAYRVQGTAVVVSASRETIAASATTVCRS